MHLKVTLTTALLLGLTMLSAQEKATTESGKKVLLWPNGTWKPVPEPSTPKPGGDYQRPKHSTDRITFPKSKFTVYYDASIWKKVGPEQPTRQTYQHKDGDGYAVVIAERMQAPLETLKNLALTNAKNVAPDARFAFEETRTVNGLKVLVLQIKGTMQGMPITYFGYYYTGTEGCIQILTYTTDNLFDEFKNDFQAFLNGFTIES